MGCWNRECWVGREKNWRLGEIVWLMTFLLELIERAVTMTMINLIEVLIK